VNSSSPIYNLKFTIAWIFVYIVIVYLLFKFLNLLLALYISLWLLNLVIEITERLFLKFNKTINTVEK